jgi:hypothetical protein
MFASGYTLGSGSTVDAVEYLLVVLDAIVYLVVVLLAGVLSFEDILNTRTIPMTSARDACWKVCGNVGGKAIAPRHPLP